MGITVPIERIIRTVAVRWYAHVLQREENILKEALNFEVTGGRKQEDHKLPGKKQVEALIKNIGLRKDATLEKMAVSVETVKGNEVNPATSVDEDYTG